MTRPTYSLLALACGAMLLSWTSAQASEPGVVRISKKAAAEPTIRAQSDGIQQVSCPECQKGFAGSGYSSHGYSGGMVHSHEELHGDFDFDGNCDYCVKSHRDPMLEYFKCKFGFLIPTGCGGAGCPPFGRYARVYPQDPSYFDQRDGQVYGASGYGVPVSVPLAPVVSHTYNYSWGMPSSRLTPVSRLAQY
ncbi:hypothetical protein GC163_18740 [bacterium]|nr:hypothetical protein [bacterium]